MPTVETDTRRWRIGYASGAFDLIHVGHLRYLQAAAGRCERLVVGVPSDGIIARVKGRAPLVPQAERLEIVAAFACVALALPVAVAMDDTDAFAGFLGGLTLEGDGVEAALIGADWADTPRWSRLRPRLEERGIAVAFLPRAAGVSSTGLRGRLSGTPDAGS